MNAFLKNFLQPILAAIFVIPLSACAYSGGPVEGAVLEEGTHTPIPGAIVVVRWEGTAFSFAHTQSVCIHVESALTDDKGHFRIPAWRASVEPAGVHDLKPLVTAYKVGYGLPTAPSQKDEIVLLAPFKGTRGERLEYLSRFRGMNCGDPTDYTKKLIPLYKSIYEEAKSIATTKEERHSVSHLLRELEELELGSNEAWKNWRARERTFQ